MFNNSKIKITDSDREDFFKNFEAVNFRAENVNIYHNHHSNKNIFGIIKRGNNTQTEKNVQMNNELDIETDFASPVCFLPTSGKISSWLSKNFSCCKSKNKHPEKKEDSSTQENQIQFEINASKQMFTTPKIGNLDDNSTGTTEYPEDVAYCKSQNKDPKEKKDSSAQENQIYFEINASEQMSITPTIGNLDDNSTGTTDPEDVAYN